MTSSGNKAYPIPAAPLVPPVALDLLPTILVTLLLIALVSTDAAFSWSGLRHVIGWLDRSVLFALRRISDGLRVFWAALNGVAKAGLFAGGLLLVIGSLMAVAGRSDRRASPITRWIRRWGGNGLWLLGLAPIWIAVVGSVSAWISYWRNGRPFLGKTKLANRPW